MKKSNYLILVLLAALSFSCANMKYNSAENYYKNKDFENASKQYEKLTKYNNETFDVSRQLADSYHKLNQYDKAEMAYAKAINTHPEQADLYYQMALVMKKMESVPKGIAIYNNTLASRKNKAKTFLPLTIFVRIRKKHMSFILPKK